MNLLRPINFRRIATLTIILAAALAPLSALAADPAPPPRLVVVVSIDQFRGDFMQRFDPFFGDDGFRRVAREGFVYGQALYPTANTETGPGHSQLLTGAYAHRSGITQNDWYEERLRKSVYCVGDSSTTLVTAPLAGEAREGFSPHRLLAGTVGDNLEVATAGQSRTVSLSLKDRSAILMGGHGADLVLWWDRSSGVFITSTYYASALPAWVSDFNASGVADSSFHKPWTLSLEPAAYASLCTADDYPSENHAAGGFAGNTFPHVMGAASQAPDADYYKAVYTSPFGNDIVLALAERAIDAEQLGEDDIPDLLTVSFSANDPIGHAFGPDSWEVLDATIKTDATIATLMRILDDKVGAGRWTLLLTADHGVASFPELLRERRIPAERVDPAPLREGLEAHLVSQNGPLPDGLNYVALLDPPWLAFNPAPFASARDEVPRLKAARIAAEWLGGQPGIALALPVADLLDLPADHDPILLALKRSYYPGRSGDVAFLLEPNNLFGAEPRGTGHGSVYRYDQHVPVLAIGAGIRQGRSALPVSPAQIAPTAATLIGVNPPNECEVPALHEALN